ncbi:MAG: hypothetical protein KAT28_01425 [Candidatus Aenigmarchaeota archaeon]|nr:hypothetical protein [Candidatus Aenigmarchaeota archaeon]
MANMSLETIVGFIILLVVAGVIISMILTRISPDSLPYKEIEMQQMDFKNKCDALCTATSSLDYCRSYFEGGADGTDWDGNGGKNELISIGDYVTWDVCEERIYCFSMVSCDRRFGSSPAKGCASALCQAYLDKYKGNVIKANEAVLDKVKPGNCQLPSDIEDNWFAKYFPADVCGCDCTPWNDIGCGSVFGCNIGEMYQNRTCAPDGCRENITRCISHPDCIPILSFCAYDNIGDNILCNTNCKNATPSYTNITVTDQDGDSASAWINGVSIGSITFLTNQINFSTSPLLSTLNTTNTSLWNVTLICANPIGTAILTGVS